MKIPNRVMRRAMGRARSLPRDLLTARKLDFAPKREREQGSAAIAKRVSFLGTGGAAPSRAEFERLMGSNDLVDEFYLERALLAAGPVCRISIRAASGHERGCATGVMVSPRLLLTNQHVLTSEDEAGPSVAEFNYRLDVAGRPEPSYRFALKPDAFFFSHEKLDYALVSVAGVSEEGAGAGVELGAFGYHRLIGERGKLLVKEWMTIIQHPGGARRQFAIRENELVEDKDPDVIWYKSDTAQGSSGSPVFNDSYQVVALHHAGVARREGERYILKSGKTVKSLDDVDDSEVDWIANAGVRVSRICGTVLEEAKEKNGHLEELRAAMQGGDIMSRAYQGGSAGQASGMGAGLMGGGAMNPRLTIGAGVGGGGRIVVGTLVLELGAGVGAGNGVVPGAAGLIIAAAGGDSQLGAMETMKEPIVDTNYKSRKGFDEKFLGVKTPMPKVVKASVVRAMKDGRKTIPYEHFSVVLHKERKLAIFTASNVDASEKAKKPETGKKYTRDVLTGLAEGMIEKWVLDPRLDAEAQIPDEFYSKDKGAFDKGHVVRREDVCFGASFAQVQRANGDTFHVTNCSPQRGNFNQSGKSGIWGQLENFIGAQADEERYCIFAGPVLAEEDKFFAGTQRVQLPVRFWKVVCAVKDGKLQTFAFVLEQDVHGVPLEFQVDAKWKHKQVTLKKLEAVIGLVKFAQVYHKADQG